MTRRVLLVPSLLRAVPLLLVVLAGCERVAPAPAPVAPPTVTVSQPIAREIVDYDEFTGRLDAVDSVDIRPRVQGYIDKISFQDGQIVNEGDVLFEIDPRPFEAALKVAEAQVAQWTARQTKAEADERRYRELIPKGAASRQDLDAAVAQAAEARAMIDGAQAQAERAQIDLDFTKIKAPFTGKAGRSRVSKGDLVTADLALGAPLTTVVSIDPIRVYFTVGERSLLRYQEHARARTGQATPPERLRDANIPIWIGLADEDGYSYEAVLDFADNAVDASTGTIEVRGELGNATGVLRPGLFCRVRVPMGDAFTAILVPDRAIGTDQNVKYVLIVDGDGTVAYRPVKLGRIHDGLRIVEEGLTADDWVVVNGIQRARPGGKVQATRVPLEGAATDRK